MPIGGKNFPLPFIIIIGPPWREHMGCAMTGFEHCKPWHVAQYWTLKATEKANPTCLENPQGRKRVDDERVRHIRVKLILSLFLFVHHQGAKLARMSWSCHAK
eukprot:6312546-Amphidinium_carterae.1